MYLEISIEVYEYGPHGHGDYFHDFDMISVSKETLLKIKEYHEKGVNDLDDMDIPELTKAVAMKKEEQIDFALNRFLGSGGDEEDFPEPEVTITVGDFSFEEED